MLASVVHSLQDRNQLCLCVAYVTYLFIVVFGGSSPWMEPQSFYHRATPLPSHHHKLYPSRMVSPTGWTERAHLKSYNQSSEDATNQGLVTLVCAYGGSNLTEFM